MGWGYLDLVGSTQIQSIYYLVPDTYQGSQGYFGV